MTIDWDTVAALAVAPHDDKTVAIEAMASEIVALRQWRDAVENELIVCHLGTADSFPDARTAMQVLLAFTTQVALDPEVSQGARDLLNRQSATAKNEGDK